MGGVGVEYVEALDVCVYRLQGTILPEEVVATFLAAAVLHPRSARLWDISEASYDEWSEARLNALVRGLDPSALRALEARVALVSTNAEGLGICRTVKRFVASKSDLVTVEVFPNRSAALKWLGVMHVPVGRVRTKGRA